MAQANPSKYASNKNGEALGSSPVLEVANLNVFYGDTFAVKNLSVDIRPRTVTAFIGPSGCGKSTLLRCFNRMNDLVDGARITGRISFGGLDIVGGGFDVCELRKQIGMVFQKSNPFPKSIFENVAFGPRLEGVRGSRLQSIVERSLQQAALWDEVSERLHESALQLSGGQQQRLCIARAIAVEPKVLLMDEPCSALDPVATGRVEELLYELKRHYTIVIVTHSMQQAARISDFTGFMMNGELIEFSATSQIFQYPKNKKTEDYIRGRFG